MPEPDHNHLTREVMPRRACPACDLIWARQDERLSKKGPKEKAEREISNLVERESKLGEARCGRRGGE